MNVMLLLAQVAPALADSVAGANPVLTPIAAPDEMNLWSMAVKGGWIMVVLGVLSVVCFYILFERNYVIRKAGKEDLCLWIRSRIIFWVVRLRLPLPIAAVWIRLRHG